MGNDENSIDKKVDRDNNMKVGKSIIEYDYVRAVAVLLVILGHCTYYSIITDYGGINFDLSSINESIAYKITNMISVVLYAFHMPLFIALSGCMWAISIQNKGIPTFKSLVKNKAKRLLLPFLFTSFFWSIPLKYLSGYWNGSFSENISQILYGQILMIGNSNSHLWFLQALFFIFIFAYLIEQAGLRKNRMLFIVLLFFLSLVARYIEQSYHICFFNIQTSLAYLIWFYVGFYFEQKRVQINSYIHRYIRLNVVFIAFLIYPALVFLNGKFFKGIELCYITYYPLAMIGMAITYILCYKVLLMTSVLSKEINILSSNSYGLYLYSDSINYLIISLVASLSLFNLFAFTSFTIGIYIVRFLINIIVAWAVINIVRKLKKTRFTF